MKTILVATDFSEAARGAALYAVELARAFNARLVLFNAYQEVPGPMEDPEMAATPDEIRQLTERLLTNELIAIDPPGSLSVSTCCKDGMEVDTILAAAQEENADMIVVAMKSKAKGFRHIFGSIAATLARRSERPLIVVPEGAKFTKPVTIALASDISPETDMKTLESLIRVGNRFQSKLYIVRVIKNKTYKIYEVLNRPARLSKVVRSLDPEYKYAENTNVTEALNEFIINYNIDLLAMVPHQHSLLERWFTGSRTRNMIFKTQVPILILPEVKIDFEEASAPAARKATHY
jgi:nucleotide-binding universal stress UspA family protein